MLDALESKNVFYKIPKIGDYEGARRGDRRRRRLGARRGRDGASNAAASVDVLVREEADRQEPTPWPACESSGGRVHVPTRNRRSGASKATRFASRSPTATELAADYVIVQIGFLSAKETFERLDLRLNEDGSIAIDPYFETSRRGIFAVGDVHGDIKLITVAWAEGIQAAIYAFKEITSPYWLNEKRLRDQKIAMIGEKITEAARGRGAGI